MSEPVALLSDSLLSELQKEKVILLHTIDAESGIPTSSAISWVYGVDSSKLRFVIDQRSRLVHNLKTHASAVVTVFAEGTVKVISGSITLVTEALEDVPFKLACFEMNIEMVQDGMFYGARISVEPEFERTYDKRAAHKLDQQVLAAMKKA